MSIHPLSSRRLVAICCGLAILALLYFGHPYFPSSTSAFIPPIASQGRHSSKPPYSPTHDLLDDISNATLGFQKIFIINLPSRTDRRDAASLAAAFTGLEVEYIDGATTVDEKAWPPGATELGLSSGDGGSWRSHMNAARLIVEQNISSALVLEDDVDWDVRIKSQMRDFARASRLLVQPLANTTDQFLDPSWPRPGSQHQNPINFHINEVSTGEPTTSPYGDLDRWDILWLGHCGCRFPWASDENVPIGRAVIPDDETVPARHHINIEFGDTQLLDQYSEHTRVVSRSRMNTCTLAYALSQAGARRLLYELGVHKTTGTCDMMMRSVCHGSDGRDLLTCLSPQPALFNHHRPVGSRWTWSDISNSEDKGWNDVASSTNIRWAARVNLPKLMKGETDYIDTYRDDE